MKQLILVLIALLFTSPCFSQVTLENVALDGFVSVGEKGHILPIGDSTTVGFGSSYTNPDNETFENVTSYRITLQSMLGIWKYRWRGTNVNPLTAEYNQDVWPYHQPNRYGWGGGSTDGVLDLATDEPQEHLTAFPYDSSKNMVLIWLGANDAEEGGDNATSSQRAVDRVETYIDLVDGDRPLTNILILNTSPSRDSGKDAWIVGHNARMLTMVNTKRLTKTNLFYVDTYTPLNDCNGTSWTSCSVDNTHPNQTGYDIVAEAIYNKIVK